MEKLLTVPEFAELVRVQSSTIYTQVGQGKIPHIRVGRLIRFKKEHVDEFLRAAEFSSLPGEPTTSVDAPKEG